MCNTRKGYYMKWLAYLFKILFRIKALRRYHFGLYQKLFKPYGWFRGLSAVSRYDKSFRLIVNLEEWIQQHIFFFGMYDIPGINYIKRTLQPDDVFIDIGANVGTYSISASGCLDKAMGGAVFAFEPVGFIYERLIENIELNKIDNIHPNKLGIMDDNKTIELFLSSKENLGMSSIFHHDTESGEKEKVEAVKLDDFITDYDIGKVSVIKIDIEGAEIFALKGMVNTLKKFRPVLLIEISENVLRGHTVSERDVFNFMRDIGYFPHFIHETGELSPFDIETAEFRTNYVFIPE